MKTNFEALLKFIRLKYGKDYTRRITILFTLKLFRGKWIWVPTRGARLARAGVGEWC